MFEKVGGMGALAVLVLFAMIGHNVSQRMDSRNIDTLILVGGAAVIALAASLAFAVGVIVKARVRAGNQSDYGWDGYGDAPVKRPKALPVNEYPAIDAPDQGQFVVRDAEVGSIADRWR